MKSATAANRDNSKWWALMPKSTATDTNSQQFVILAYLKINGSMTTLQARQELDVMHPAARVQELREKGNNIMTHWTIAEGHRIASYVLLAKVCV